MNGIEGTKTKKGVLVGTHATAEHASYRQ